MVSISWTERLRVGVEAIDEQHQELFRRAERLVHALEAGDRAGVEPVLRYLSDYAVSHFECEERWMEEAEYPGLESHRDAHRRFKDEFRELTREYQRAGPTPATAVAIHDWLAGWLVQHIGSVDVEMGRWMKARGLTPGR